MPVDDAAPVGVYVPVVMVMVVIVGMGMAMGVAAPSVSPALRLKGRHDRLHRAAKAERHGFENMIRLHAQEYSSFVAVDFQSHVPVAEMIGGPRKLQGVACADLQQGLLCGRNGHHPLTDAVRSRQFVAVSQARAGGKLIAEILPARQTKTPVTPSAPHLVGELQGIRSGDGRICKMVCVYRAQNRKYLRLRGSVVAGSQRRSSPSALTS